ncbi:hypothetical protein BX600DRAFT_430953 [Xylariales sp. PMI_506]|nr:hypothetical protein BX600DRAFT_430953 [Xylariales sp. PMI_506]
MVGGTYDPIRYRNWLYDKIARNPFENEPEDPEAFLAQQNQNSQLLTEDGVAIELQEYHLYSEHGLKSTSLLPSIPVTQILDGWGARLWDIEPHCQVAGIVDNRTVTLDGTFGATVCWRKRLQVAFMKRKPLTRTIAVFLPRAMLAYLIFGLILLIIGSSFPGGLGMSSLDGFDGDSFDDFSGSDPSFTPMSVMLIATGGKITGLTVLLALFSPAAFLRLYQRQVLVDAGVVRGHRRGSRTWVTSRIASSASTMGGCGGAPPAACYRGAKRGRLNAACARGPPPFAPYSSPPPLPFFLPTRLRFEEFTERRPRSRVIMDSLEGRPLEMRRRGG